ncbi:unnamed protein product [Cylicostephanus goldi]|uniref:Uncharacterized protein n=1 Tax=Cylicostephanus goldi TaxID=71465 RepID=A0A3P6T6K4_CYLGO|nr:unnamed protein product [Cylicostephanus goldi]
MGSKEQSATPQPQYPSQEHISKEDIAKPAKETQPVIKELPPFKRSRRKPRKAVDSGKKPQKPEGAFAKLKKVVVSKFRAVLGSRAKQPLLNVSSRKKSTPTIPSARTRSRRKRATAKKLSQDSTTPIASDETLRMFTNISAEPMPQIFVSSIEGRKPPVWRKADEEANQPKADDGSRSNMPKTYPGTFKKEVRGPPVWRKANSLAVVETPSREK